MRPLYARMWSVALLLSSMLVVGFAASPTQADSRSFAGWFSASIGKISDKREPWMTEEYGYVPQSPPSPPRPGELRPPAPPPSDYKGALPEDQVIPFIQWLLGPKKKEQGA